MGKQIMVRLTQKALDAFRVLDHVEAKRQCEAIQDGKIGACRHGWYALSEPNRLFDRAEDALLHARYREAVPLKENR